MALICGLLCRRKHVEQLDIAHVRPGEEELIIVGHGAAREDVVVVVVLCRRPQSLDRSETTVHQLPVELEAFRSPVRRVDAPTC